jgi:hypothetical protein
MSVCEEMLTVGDLVTNSLYYSLLQLEVNLGITCTENNRSYCQSVTPEQCCGSEAIFFYPDPLSLLSFVSRSDLETIGTWLAKSSESSSFELWEMILSRPVVPL